MKREAREIGVVLQGKQKALDEQVARLEDLDREIGILEAELERLRGVQQAREKDRVALEHEMRKLGDDTNRANSRLSVARLELDRLKRDAERSAEQRGANQQAVAEKEELREQREQELDDQRQFLEKLEVEAAALGEDHSALRAELAGLEERHRGERAAMGRLEAQHKDATVAAGPDRRGDRAAGRASRRIAGRQHRVGSQAGIAGASRHYRREAAVNRLAAEEARMREGSGRRRRGVEAAPHEGRRGASESLADRSGAGAAPGRVEVSGRDQPQGIELLRPGTDCRRTRPCPMRMPSPKPKSYTRKSAHASRRWVR